MPVSGSFSTYGARYVEEGFGFALGWNYWYNWAVTVAVDLVAAQLVMAYWFPDIPGVYWSALFLAITFGLNALSARGFGEAEFWFALIKVVAVLAFVVMGVMMLLGIIRGGETGGLANWTVGDAPFAGGFAALIGVAMVVGFSFQGTELIGIAAGESGSRAQPAARGAPGVLAHPAVLRDGHPGHRPAHSLYRSAAAAHRSHRRQRQPLRADLRARLLAAASVMNAVVLTSVLSAGNSGMYAATRMLYSLARDGKAPAVFGRVTGNGVPLWALVATTVVAALCFFSFIFSPKAVYVWLLNTSGMTGFIAWLGIAISHYRFRRGYVAQGRNLADLPYVSPFFPFGPIFAFALCLIITLGQNYQAFLQDRIDWGGVVATYVGIPLFLLIWLGYRLVRGSRFVSYRDMRFPDARARSEYLDTALRGAR